MAGHDKTHPKKRQDLELKALLQSARDADLDARREVELLASLMATPDAIQAIGQTLRIHHFSTPGARAIFGAMLELAASGTPPTLVTLGTSLSRIIDCVHIDGHSRHEAIVYLDGMDRGRLATPSRYVNDILDAYRNREEVRAVRQVQEWLDTPRAIRPPMVELLKGLIDDQASQIEGALVPVDACDLIAKHPQLRDPIIEGLLRSGETMNLVAASKVGKSWLALYLALSIATGRDWLGHACRAGKVLYLDNELHEETFAVRLARVAEAYGIVLHRGQIEILTLRGRLKDLLSMRPYFDSIKPGQYAAIVLDAMYRFLPSGSAENSNDDMKDLYNLVDHHADRIGCAFIQVHHSSKGSQAGRSVTDVGAGAGSQSRAADAHIVLRPHEDKNVFVLDAALRSWPPMKPTCLRWAWPRWDVDREADPTRLAGGTTKSSSEEKERKAAEKRAAKEEAARQEQEKLAEEAYQTLLSFKKGATKTKWKAKLGFNTSKMDSVILHLTRAGRIEPCEVQVNSGGGKRMEDGFIAIAKTKSRSRTPGQKT